MFWVMIGYLEIEDKAAHIAEQDDDTARVYQFAQQVQVRRDDAHTKLLCRLLVAVMTFLLSQVVGGYTLHVVKEIEQWIAEELRKYQ